MTCRAVIFACARDETRYIGEWLGYHRAIGFGHVFLYCNDDDPAPLFDAVEPFTTGAEPFVTFHHHPLQGEQFYMYMHALRHHRAAGEWIAFLDIDEFLALRAGGTIDDLLDDVPPGQDCLLLHWLMFGPNGHATPPAGGVPESYTRRAARAWNATKTITRSAAIDPDRIERRIYLWHGWEGLLIPPGIERSVLGLPREAIAVEGSCLADPAATAEICRRAGVHHYVFRSEAALAQRLARGLGGDFHGQAMWQRAQEQGATAAHFAELDAVEDRFLAEFVAARRHRRLAQAALLAPPPWPNLALGRAATQSSVSPASRHPDPGRDAAGATSGRITGDYQFHTDHDADPYWQVDLGGPARIHEIRLFNRLSSPAVAERFRRFVIETSSDGARWMLVCRKDDAAPVGGIDGNPFRFRPTAPVPARWVRIRLRRPGLLHLDQVEVYGRMIPSGGSGA